MREGVGAIQGTVDDRVASDFPGLRLWSIHCMGPGKKGSKAVEERIGQLDDRVRGLAVGDLRTDSVAGSYRAFARQVGLDPDIERNALDEAAVARLTAGRFKTKGLLEQALLVAMLETGVPLWAIDAGAVYGWLRVIVGDDEQLWLGDDQRELAPMLCPVPDDVCATIKSDRVLVVALRVNGVPATTVEEAFWHVRACLEEDQD